MIYLNTFRESFTPNSELHDIKSIVGYLNKNGVDLYKYDEIWFIQKKSIFLLGELFLSIKDKKAIRFNWSEQGLKTKIHSIDIWLNFKFNTIPHISFNIDNEVMEDNRAEILQLFKGAASSIKTYTPIEERAETASQNIDQLEDKELKNKVLDLTKSSNLKSINFLSTPMYIGEDYDKLEFLAKRISPDIVLSDKMRVIKYLSILAHQSPHILNVANIIHAINFSLNKEEIAINHKKIEVWKILIKKYL